MLKMTIPAAAMGLLAASGVQAGEDNAAAATLRDLDGHVVHVLTVQERASNDTLRKAERHIMKRFPGVVETVARDDEPSMHYHVDVRLTNGALARLAVTPYTGQLSWREPAVLRD